MGQKDNSIPRRVYRAKGMSIVCVGGQFYGKRDSAIGVKMPAKVTKNEDGSVTVAQRAPKKKGVSETWRKVNL